MSSGNIVEQAKVAVALDGRDAETVLAELTAKTNQYTDALIKAYQAGDKLSMKNALQDLKDTEKELATFQKLTFDVTKVLNNLNGTSLKDLKKAEQEITAELNKMTRGTDEYVNKTKDLQKVTGEISKVKTEMKGLSQESQDSGFSFKHMWEVAGGVGMVDLAKKGFGLLKEGIKWVIDSSEPLRESWERTTAGIGAGLSVLGNEFMKMGEEAAKGSEKGIGKINQWTNELGAVVTAIVETGIHFKQGKILYEQLKKASDDASLSAIQYTAMMQELEKEEIKLIAPRAKAFADIMEARAKGHDENISLIERIKLLKEAKSEEETMTNEAIALQDKRVTSMAALKQSFIATNRESQWGENSQREKDYQAAIAKTYELKSESLSKIRHATNELISLEKEMLANELKRQEFLGKGSETDKENARYASDLLKAKEFYTKEIINYSDNNAKKIELEKEYAQVQENMKMEHAAKLNKIDYDKNEASKADQKLLYDDMAAASEESDKQVLATRKQQYTQDLIVAGNNATARKLIEEKYKQDVLTIQLSQLESSKAMMLFYGQDTTKITQQIEDKKNEIIESGLQTTDNNTKEHQAILKQFGLLSLAQQEAEEIAQLDAFYKDKQNLTDEYEQALLLIKLKYAKQYISSVEPILSNLSNTIKGFQDAELTNLETQKQKELNAVGDNADAQKKINDKYAKEELATKKKYADKTFAIQVAQIVASTAKAAIEAVAACAELGPWGIALGIVEAGVAIAYGASQIAQAKAQRDSVKQLAKGKYNVIGADDGQHYDNVPYIGQSSTRLYTKPTLISERGPELVIAAPHVRNLQMNYPEVLNAIMATRVPQYAAGNYPVSGSQQSTTANNDQLVQIVAANMAIMNKLNDRLNEPINAEVVMDKFAKVKSQYDAQISDITQS